MVKMDHVTHDAIYERALTRSFGQLLSAKVESNFPIPAYPEILAAQHVCIRIRFRCEIRRIARLPFWVSSISQVPPLARKSQGRKAAREALLAPLLAILSHVLYYVRVC